MHVSTLHPPVRALFLSDLHLGSRHCHAAEIAAFIGRQRCQTLYLVGDIIDLWWMSQRRAVWDAAHQQVIAALHAQARRGTEIIYVPGNHDRAIRRFCGLVMPAMQVRRRSVHTLLDGRRLLVTHGDDYDAQTHFGGLQERFGDWLYYRILTGNQLTNRLRRRLGMRYWSLAEFSSAAAVRPSAISAASWRPAWPMWCAAIWTASSAGISIAPHCACRPAISTPTPATGWRA